MTVRWAMRPQLRTPVLVAAFEGWNDAANAASDAVRFLAHTASAVELATAVWIEGFDTLTRAIGQLAAYLEEQGSDAADIVGESADAVMTYEEVQAVRRAT